MFDISLIVPVYNKGDALIPCLDSIKKQSFQRFECILVDDGSTDGCAQICDRYARDDPRFKVIHKTNGGVSSARNAGIHAASGTYLMFCDADDTIPKDALESLILTAQKTDCQLILGELSIIQQDVKNNKLRTTKSLNRTYQEITLSVEDRLLNFWSQNDMMSSCGKLFLTNIIVENHLQFDTDLIVLEDFAFVIDYLRHCSRICMIPQVVYHYIWYSSESPIHKRSRKDFLFDTLDVCEKLERYLADLQVSDPDPFLRTTIYPTLGLSYDALWAIEVPTATARKKKYHLISLALANDTVQKMMAQHKGEYSRWEYWCIKAKSVPALVILHALRRLIKRKH